LSSAGASRQRHHSDEIANTGNIDAGMGERPDIEFE